jgi:hypothetical protein
MSAWPGRYILTNFTHGYGPFIRTTECALAVARVIERITGERQTVVVPWVYGEAQRRILREEWPDAHDKVVLDAALGHAHASVTYGAMSYAESLTVWLGERSRAEDTLAELLARPRTGETLDGKEVPLARAGVSLVITRAPRLRVRGMPAYGVGFGHVSDILQQALAEPGLVASPNRRLFDSAAHAFRQVEAEHRLHLIADPGTASVWNAPPRTLPREVVTPPTISLPPAPDLMVDQPAVYASVSGVQGRSSMVTSAREFGLEVYTNAPEHLPGGMRATPGVLRLPSFMFHYARPGWGAIWTTVLAGVPLVMPPPSGDDDPEIVFNTRWVERVGVGVVDIGQKAAELCAQVDQLRSSVAQERARVADRFGTLDGVSFVAEQIAADWLEGCEQ